MVVLAVLEFHEATRSSLHVPGEDVGKPKQEVETWPGISDIKGKA